ncbi:RNA-binding protein [Acetonema longum]|uniref:RNA-binding S4 domain protein n=1 Tax=Acetonema longum DSM 6540 TaxID=1009370 RepID=F7NLB7_9FIRM|nr:YlmH/Sll1252 family protein [Acetonema longum]EGO63222.1 RNA-binding S4 domain protein [Acetonema longum DSM 6540]
MSEREKIIRYYRASGEAELAAKLLDIAEAALRYQKYKISDFLDPFGISVAETIIAHYGRLRLASDGGYPGAERVKAAFVTNDYMGTIDFGISVLAVQYDSRYYSLSHRDVLGALTGAGLKREVIGDIIPGDRQYQYQILIDAKLVEFVLRNLTQIGPAPVQLSLLDLTEIVPREETLKEIRATVASLRLDSVAAAGFGTSRTKMAAEIMAEKVRVNWQDARNSSQIIKPGDVIAMRGRGRVEVCEIGGQTKKGRTSLLLKRYL